MLRSFKQPSSRFLGREPTGSSQCFDDSRGAHAAEEGLVRETGDAGPAVTVEDVLAALDLGPVDPGGDVVNLGP